MTETLTEVRLYGPDRTAPLLSAAATRDVLGPLVYSAEYDEPDTLSTVTPQFAPGVEVLRRRATLRTVHAGDGTSPGDLVRWWRAESVDESIGDADLEVRVRWRPLWLDVADTVARPADVLGSGVEDLSLRLVDRLLPDALAVVLSPDSGAPTTAGGAPLLAVGTVDDALLAEPSSYSAQGGTTLDAVEALTGDARAVYTARVVPAETAAEETYALDLAPAPEPDDGDAPVVEVRLAVDGSDATRFARTAEASGAVSAVIPVASRPPSLPAGLGQNRLPIASVSGASVSIAGAPGGEPPRVVWEDGALVGLQAVVLARTGGATPSAVYTVVGSASPATLTLAPAPPADTAVVRLLAEDGAPLVRIESPSLVAEYGRAEKALDFDGVSPLANLLTDPGAVPVRVSADLTHWPTPDRPQGVGPISESGTTPTLTRETNTDLVRYGGAASV